VPTDHLRPPSFRFFAGELPLSIIKMKTRGVAVQLSFNTGFTLPTNMNELGDIQKLDLSNCSFTGPHLLPFIGGIPESFGQLENLEELCLSYNKLEGHF
jgi:hypothetical protein